MVHINLIAMVVVFRIVIGEFTELAKFGIKISLSIKVILVPFLHLNFISSLLMIIYFDFNFTSGDLL